VKEEKKQPKLDSSASAQKTDPEIVEARSAIESLRKQVLTDGRGNLTPAGRNLELQRSEEEKARKQAADPEVQRDLERDRQRQADRERAKDLDAKIDLLQAEAAKIRNSWKPFGVEPCAEVAALLDRWNQHFVVDIEDSMRRHGFDGAAQLISQHEQFVIPDLREKCNAIQNVYMAKLSEDRAVAAAKQAEDEVKRLGPDKALKELESNGLRLRVADDGQLETAGPIDANAAAILRLYKPAIIERLRQRENWTRVEA
jgi:hypothetical protein